MNEVTAMRDQDNEAFGAFLIEAIAKPLGIKLDKDAAGLIGRAVYKGTSCGAWVRFDAEGIMVGTIVEGSDAEYSERIKLDGIEPSEEGATELNRRFWSALDRCEDFLDEVWAEMDAEQD